MKRRVPGSHEDALLIIMGELGADECAKIIGKSSQRLYQYADPDHDDTLNFRQMRALDLAYVGATGNEPPLLRSYADEMHLPLGIEPDADFIRIQTLRVQEKVGTLAGTVLNATSPDSADGVALSPNERHGIQRVFSEVCDICSNAMRMLNPKRNEKP